MAQEGLLALWRGWLPSVIGVVPYVGLNFAVYETSKDVILKHYGTPPTSRMLPIQHPTHDDRLPLALVIALSSRTSHRGIRELQRETIRFASPTCLYC